MIFKRCQNMKLQSIDQLYIMMILSITMVLITGCANQYPTSISQDVNDNISVVDIQNGLKPDNRTLIRWGGVIAQVNNNQQNTWLEVVQLPLDNQGEPLNSDASSGRFLVNIKQFLDPAIYAKGRAFTVVGTLKGVSKGKIGEHPYQYPVVEASGFQLWPRKKEVVYRTLFYPLGYWSPFYSYYYPRYPYFRGYYPRPGRNGSHSNSRAGHETNHPIPAIEPPSKPQVRSVPSPQREK